MPIDFEQLTLDGIAQFARIDSSLRSLEQTVNLIRSDNALLMAQIQEVKLSVNDINHKLENNVKEHADLNKRIDSVVGELDEVRDIVATSQSTGCAIHAATASELAELKALIDQLDTFAKIFAYKLLGAPVWVILLGMIILGFIVDLVAHAELVQRILNIGG